MTNYYFIVMTYDQQLKTIDYSPGPSMLLRDLNKRLLSAVEAPAFLSDLSIPQASDLKGLALHYSLSTWYLFEPILNLCASGASIPFAKGRTKKTKKLDSRPT